MKIWRKYFWWVLVGAILIFLPINVLTKGPGPEKKVIDYVALGDSLAAGMTPNNQTDVGYPDYLVKHFEQSQYRVNYNNLAVSGSTSVQLRDDVLSKQEVRNNISAAEYITIDIGGNDLNAAINADPTGATVPVKITGITDNIKIILQTIDDLNPKAKVFVMGYFNPYPKMPAEKQTALLPLLKMLNNEIEKQSIANGDSFVSTFEVIAKDYETYLPNPGNVHLSLEGYQLVANEFWKEIEKSSRDNKEELTLGK